MWGGDGDVDCRFPHQAPQLSNSLGGRSNISHLIMCVAGRVLRVGVAGGVDGDVGGVVGSFFV